MTHPVQHTSQDAKNGLGTAALVLGIVGFLLAWIPFIGFVGFILGVLAMALGGVGAFNAHKGTATNPVVAWVGVGLGAVAFVVSSVVFGSAMNSLNQEFGTTAGVAQQGVPAAPPAAGAGSSPTTVEVFGQGGGDVSVTVVDAGSSTTESAVALPYSEELPDGYASVAVTAGPSVESYQNGAEPAVGDVGCRILRNGQVIDEQHAAGGEFASATCTKFR